MRNAQRVRMQIACLKFDISVVRRLVGLWENVTVLV
jgi:hypothetical protein